MSEENIVPMEDSSEESENLELQEKVANALGTKIIDLVRGSVKDAQLHPRPASLLLADVAAMHCSPGGYAGVAIYLEAMARHCRAEAEHQQSKEEESKEEEKN